MDGMNGCMNEWTWMNKWMDDWNDALINGWMDGWIIVLITRAHNIINKLWINI